MIFFCSDTQLENSNGQPINLHPKKKKVISVLKNFPALIKTEL